MVKLFVTLVAKNSLDCCLESIGAVRCNQRASTDGFAEQNGRDAGRTHIKSKIQFDKQTAT